MALESCPHMTARCPHYRNADCTDPASKDCHYIKRTTASMVAALHAIGIERLSPAMRENLKEMESFFRE